MSLFQKSVEKKYLNELDCALVENKFNDFQSYFGDTEIQENIRNLKEEEFQEGFIRELFVNILNYTLKPTPEYNIVLEKKNVDDTKKADGAILSTREHAPLVIAVIELKSTLTADLDTVETQAFGYKNHHPECVYVITSNFEKLRFYIQNAVDYLEFDLFNLSKEQFSLLWLCLSKDNILNDLPLTIKESSVLQEEDVTKKLYTDYSKFREAIFENIAKNNPDKNELLLFNKTQKLLDRFLFIFFAEDRLLLPPNSISEIVKQWTTLKEELDAYIPLYDRFKKYFGYMNTGYKGKKYDIFPYNGGLFLPDEILDNITIDDNILYEYTVKLSAYDFETDVDVNILGHIFEHSLAEIENVQAKLRGEQIDKQKTKRKKEGIYYTPKYITKYIVENTVGKLCEEKRNKLEIIDEEYTKGRKNRKKDTIKALDKKLTAYKNWLLSLTILDPACGSGAFLNQALEFLINEHKKVDKLRAQLLGDAIIFSDIITKILEKNIYGVDINEESIEIAKLSLWLRTAQKGRKLNTLSSNIKCGNSLIDNPEVAGEKAFNWQKEFPAVFEKGGFDVVIGNPPYVRAELLGEYRDFFKQHFNVFNSASDLFAYFYELGSNLINEKGIMGYISNTFDKTTAGKILREYLTIQVTFEKYIDFTEVQIFEGATTYPVIITLNKNKPGESNQFNYIKIPKASKSSVIDINFHNSVYVEQNTLESDSWAFLPVEKVKIFQKVRQFPALREKYGKCYRGLITGLNEAFLAQNNFSISNHVKYIYEGKEIKKWHTPTPQQKLVLFESKWTKATYGSGLLEKQAFEKLKAEFPELMEHLSPFEEKAKKRYDKGDFWWELRNCAYYDLFDKPKIVFPNLQNQNKFCLDSKGVFINAPAVFLPVASKTLLCILNSKVVWEFLKSICVVRSGGYIEVKPQYFEQIPIPKFINEESFNQKADEIINYTSESQTAQSNFINLLQSKFDIEKLSKKLQNWNELEFKEFLKELKKAKVQLSLSEEAEWMQYFNKQKQKAQELKTEINRIDNEIGQMVYELYGLTEDEIKIVEGEA